MDKVKGGRYPISYSERSQLSEEVKETAKKKKEIYVQSCPFIAGKSIWSCLVWKPGGQVMQEGTRDPDSKVLTTLRARGMCMRHCHVDSRPVAYSRLEGLCSDCRCLKKSSFVFIRPIEPDLRKTFGASSSSATVPRVLGARAKTEGEYESRGAVFDRVNPVGAGGEGFDMLEPLARVLFCCGDTGSPIIGARNVVDSVSGLSTSGMALSINPDDGIGEATFSTIGESNIKLCSAARACGTAGCVASSSKWGLGGVAGLLLTVPERARPLGAAGGIGGSGGRGTFGGVAHEAGADGCGFCFAIHSS